MRNPAMHKVISVVLYTGYIYIAFFALMMLVLVGGEYGQNAVRDLIWGADSEAGSFLGWLIPLILFLFGFAGVSWVWERLSSWRTKSAIRIHVPNYQGEQIPIYQCLATPGGDIAIGENMLLSLGVTPTEFFLLSQLNTGTRAREIATSKSGKLLMQPDDKTRYFSIPKDEILGIGVIGIDDGEIKKNARAAADDIFMENAITSLMGRGKMKVIPFAATLYIVMKSEDGTGHWEFALPTDISDEAITALTTGLSEDFGDSGSELVSRLAVFAADGGADALGEMAGSEVLETAGDAVGIASAFMPRTGSTKGTKGRFMAEMIAARLRHSAGLPPMPTELDADA